MATIPRTATRDITEMRMRNRFMRSSHGNQPAMSKGHFGAHPSAAAYDPEQQCGLADDRAKESYGCLAVDGTQNRLFQPPYGRLVQTSSPAASPFTVR